jgi:GxxExxY protein
MPTAAELDRLAHEVVGAAITVHRKIGPGCFESAYAPCFSYELRKRGLAYRSEVAIPLQYEEITVLRAYVADYIVEECVVVELKSVSKIGRIEERQLLTYLKMTGLPFGYVLNFGEVKLLDGIMRRVNLFPDGSPPSASGTGRRADSAEKPHCPGSPHSPRT